MQTQLFFKLIILFGIIAIVIPPVIFIYQFNELNIGKPQDWAIFGDYYSGIATPILAFLSVILLYKTLTFQKEATTKSIGEIKKTAIINQRTLEHQLSLKYLNELDSWLPAAFTEFESLSIKVPITDKFGNVELKSILLTEFDQFLRDNQISTDEIASQIMSINNVFDVRRCCILAHRAMKICSSYLKLNGFNEHRNIQMLRVANFSCCLTNLSKALEIKEWPDKIDDAVRELHRLLDKFPERYFDEIERITSSRVIDLDEKT